MRLLFHLLTALSILLIACDPSENISRNSMEEYEELGGFIWKIETDSAFINLRIVPGNNDTLVLLHGFGPLPQYQWQEIVKQIHPVHTVIVPEMVFFGNSTSQYENYSPEFQASQLMKALNTCGFNRFFITGLSFGGLISSIIAYQYTDQVKGLILLDALSQFISNSYSDSISNAYGFTSRKDLLLPKNGKDMKKMLEITYFDPPSYPSFILDKPAKSLFSKNRVEKEKMLEYLIQNETKLKESNYEYNGPVCIIWGKEDILIPVDIAYKLSKYYPGAENPVILENTGHAAQMESPDLISQTILEFMEKKKGSDQ